MSLREVSLKRHYASDVAALIEDFYEPALAHARFYDRGSGFFSSGIFSAIETALTGFLDRGGKMRLICSPRLSEDDAQAIAAGEQDRLIAPALIDDMDRWDESVGSSAPSSILRCLVASGRLEIRIAIPRSGAGMFHPKFGIFTDVNGDKVVFHGSLNESLRGWTAYGNTESFDVYNSWDEAIAPWAREHVATFDRYWGNNSPHLRVLEARRLPEVFEPRNNDLDYESALASFRDGRRVRVTRESKEASGRCSPRDLQEHQRIAIENWKRAGSRGIIDFVTGGGKTITALAAAREWLSSNRPVLVLVPSEILLDQWAEEIDHEIGLDRVSLVRVGGGVPPATWVPQVRTALEAVESSVPNLILGTYDSVRTNSFLNQVDATRSELLVIADEAHVIGASKASTIMDRINAPARLGLSATPERFGDPAGTARIFDYFGPVVEPHFGIAEAIAAARLVEYRYEIHQVELTEEEDASFESLTTRIRQLFIQKEDGDDVGDQIDMLLRARANVIKNAEGKTRLAVEILKNEMHRRHHWLVYCNSLRQIAEIRTELKDQGVDSIEYHSELSKGERRSALSHFDRLGGVLLAVHCLDQGVDIPKIDAAIVVASSTNPREYIQRRGRILRWSPGKNRADLHDIVTLTRRDVVALNSDIERARQIAEHAENREIATALVDYFDQCRNPNTFDTEDEDERESKS